MTIVINSIRFLTAPPHDFFYDYLVGVAQGSPAHRFIFVVPPAFVHRDTGTANISYLASTPLANNPLMWKLWLDYTLPAIVRKQRGDLLIHTSLVCSRRTKVPQWLMIGDLSFLHFPVLFPKRSLHFHTSNMPAYLQKANKIITTARFLSDEVKQRYALATEKITELRLPVEEQYLPIDWREKETVKDKYAEGKEYFLFTGEIHRSNQLVNLLKAFSFFKKRQKSNMQLIIAATNDPVDDPFMEMIKSYKYRGEVSILKGLTAKERVKVTAAAYAFVYPSLYIGIPLYPLQAMQCEVPVITTASGAFSEVAGDAALYADPDNFEDIAEKMMLVFKDEVLRRELIVKGKIQVHDYNNLKTADLFTNELEHSPNDC